MKKIVIIGSNDFQNQLILKAKSLGYETHVFSWKDGSIGEKTADFFYPISIIEKEKILEECRRIKPDGICSIASDLATVTINHVAENLGLPCNGIATTLQCTNKYEMRKKMKSAGVKTPGFIKVKNNSKEYNVSNLRLPLIVKPTDRSGSRGITKVTKISELPQAIEYATKDSFEKSAIVEEYIDGDEYSCECISYKGKHTFLTITKKFTTGAPNFIEIGHIQPAGLTVEMSNRVKQEVFKALNALNITNSASHTEFKINKNGDIGIIEVGARMGGDCIGSDLVFLSTGYDFMKMVIDVAIGNEPDFKTYAIPRKTAIKFIFNKRDINNLNVLLGKNPDSIYRISEFELENIGKAVDSSTRVGYYIYFPEGDRKNE